MKKWSEETISMVLGVLMVAVISFIVIKVVDNNKGKIDIPGVTIEKNIISNSVNDSGKEEPTSIGKNDGESGKLYEVKSGDSLWKISESQLNDGWKWKEIAKLNEISNPGIIRVGMKLKLPEIEKADTVLEKKLPVMGKDYEVGRGDNLWNISLQAYGDGYRWVDVWEANKTKLNNPGLLEIGMKLFIPDPDAETDGKGVIK